MPGQVFHHLVLLNSFVCKNIVEDESLESSESSVEGNSDKWVGVYEGTEKMEFRVLKTNENHSVRLKLDKTSPWCSAKNVTG